MEDTMKIRFRLEASVKNANKWRTMYDARGFDIIVKTEDAAKRERTKAIKRHKPYGRDYDYRIVKITEEIVG